MKSVNVSSARSKPAFLARGLASLAEARRSGGYVDANELMRRLTAKLELAAKRQKPTHR
ncbi:MAG: hypothetical protein V4645_26630 [Pseudomonadota bacterium]